MKKILFIVFSLQTFISCTHQANQKVEDNVFGLLKNKQYFELRDFLTENKQFLSKKTLWTAQAFIDNVFNKNSQSNDIIENLMRKYRNELSDSLKAEILLVQSDNYLKLFEYKKALESNNRILKNYKSVIDSIKLADIETMNNIYRPLKNIGPQKVMIASDNYIPIKRDIAGLMNVEVNIHDSTYDFIFDTGAGMSVIKRSFARKLGLKVLETSIDVKAATGKIVKSELAVVDSLNIGNILVMNSVFLVMDDQMLEFPQIKYFPLAVIGFPVIEEFKEFTITKSDTLIVPVEPTKNQLANMRLNGLSPNVYLYNGNDTLEYAFDTGAKRSHFTSSYFKKYQTELVKKAKKDSVTTSSAGGAKTHAAYLIDSCYLFIGDKKATLNNVYVHKDYNDTFKDVYGNLGQDLIKQFDKMTLNFESMYLKFE